MKYVYANEYFAQRTQWYVYTNLDAAGAWNTLHMALARTFIVLS